jgi:hypothetical protein
MGRTRLEKAQERFAIRGQAVDAPAIALHEVHQDAHPFSFSSLRLSPGRPGGIALLLVADEQHSSGEALFEVKLPSMMTQEQHFGGGVKGKHSSPLLFCGGPALRRQVA